jgi:methionine synthase II (cobalamin-independent)
MTTNFSADSLPALIGSLPLDNHRTAIDLVMKHSAEIPLWVQLPCFQEEGMMAQFLPGMPGLKTIGDKTFVDTSDPGFDEELIAFYEEYIAVTEGGADLNDSRFQLTPQTAAGFFEFIKKLDEIDTKPMALKAQITGPFTFGVGVTDQNDRAIFYDDRLRDVMVKLIAMKARWQVAQLKKYGLPIILFFDEPALTGFGSSAFISITKEDTTACFKEVIAAVHAEGGLTGIHVCANAEWSLILDSPADIVSFDAYSYFDKFVLYADDIRNFMASGKILAWGIVPTLNAEDLEKESTESLTQLWKERAAQIEALGIDPAVIKAQSLITPSCGTGSLSLELATRALQMTSEVSKNIRNL